jgi:phosphate transport system substrate-binding protein
MSCWVITCVLIWLVLARESRAVGVDPALPEYTPRAVELPTQASYLTADKAVAVIGYNDMQEMLEALDAVFERAHPGITFALTLKGTRTAPPALATGVSAFAPMGAEFSDAELAVYRRAVGADPIAFRVAHDSLNPNARSAPLALYVSAANPLTVLTIEQVARIFSRRPGEGIRQWAQLGLSGEWARQGVHACGLSATTALGTFMQRHIFGGRPYIPGFTGLPQSADVVRLVSEDRRAIGFAALNVATPAVRVVPISTLGNSLPSSGAADDIVAGRYPLDRHLLIYVRLAPGRPLDPIVREYLRLVLSREGQEAIAGGPLGYLPLNVREVAAEQARLDAIP